MKVITVTNEKGGTGKTTISINLFKALKEKGFNVCLVDTDPTKASFKWGSRLEIKEMKDDVYSVNLSEFNKDVIEKNLNNYDFVIVDGKPILDEEYLVFPKISDYMLIPTLVSKFDLDATLNTIFLANKYNDKLKNKISVIVNMFDSRKKMHNYFIDNLLEENVDIILKLKNSSSFIIYDNNSVYDGKNQEVKSTFDYLRDVVLDNI